MAVTILLSIGVSFTPVFTNINPGREFIAGNEIVYKISEDSDEGEEEVAAGIVDKVADEMRNRLETYKIEDYSVKIEGNDTVRVALSVSSETELNYITRYLNFNGGDFSLATAEEETRLTADKIFVDSVATIVRQDDLVPYVLFPVSDTAQVKTLLETLKTDDSSSETSSKIDVNRASEDTAEEEESATPNVYLWANWAEGDSYEKAQQDPSKTGQKIIASFVGDNIWYKEGLKDDEEPTQLQFLCGFSDSEGNYDTSKLKESNMLATFICNMFNASSYKINNKQYQVENLFVTESSSGISYNQIKTNASAENLLIFGSSVNVAMSATMISTLVAIVIISLILVLFYRVAALGIMANNLGGIMLSFVIFMALGATFNFGALVGGILLGVSSLAMSVLYMNKLKEEVYKGRALRKAHQEAMKKITLPSIDFAVIGAFSGLMIYLLGGNALKSLGILLFFGSIISLLMVHIIFRIMMALLTNATSMQNNYKALNIDEKLVPNIMKEEKPTYVAPYENTNFVAKKKPVAIVSAILCLASVVGIVVFGSIKGSPLNITNATNKTTQVYTSIKYETESQTISTEQSFKDDVLAKIYVNGDVLSYSNVELDKRETYDYVTTLTDKYIYYVTSLNYTLSTSDKISVELTSGKIDATDLDDAIEQKVQDILGVSSVEYVTSSSKESYETSVAPHQGYVALASAIAIVGSCFYLALRYKPSRGFAALTLSSASVLLTYGLFVLCRIQATPICSLIMPIAAVVSLLSSVLYFEKEKELLKENKHNISAEDRNKLLIKASSLSASTLFISSILSAYAAINYFGFGYKSMAPIFAGMLISVVLSALFTTTLLMPTSEMFSRWFKGIKLPTIKIDRAKRQRIKMQNKPKTSEPEETIFIGIND